MKKIAINTITDGANYGNRLQNLALQNVLENLGFDVFTVHNLSFRDKSFFRKIFSYIKQCLKAVLKKPNTILYYSRKKIFEDFNREYIKFDNVFLKNNNYPEGIDNKYDYIVCGSDQIWNTSFGFIKDNIYNYLGAFAHNTKRIAYASSFGVDFVQKEYIDIFKRELCLFSSISVRENGGRLIINKLLNINVPVVLDPTLLLSRDVWRKYSKKPSYIKKNEKFIVTYLMGKYDDGIEDKINQVKHELKADMVVELQIEFLLSHQINEYYTTSPSEFLWLIDNSECVITDSYHAVVFSLLFHKKFIPLQRELIDKESCMNSRFDTLFEELGINATLQNYEDIWQLYNLDYDSFEVILKKRKKDSLDFLVNALV